VPLPGTGLIEADPLFSDQTLFDFTYLPDSPCIDAGDPELFDPDGTGSDIGALPYYQEFVPTGDCNEDLILDVLDIITIVNGCILCDGDDCGDCSCADLNGDSQINVLDIILVVNMILYGSEF